MEEKIRNFWRRVVPLLQSIDVSEISRDIHHLKSACDNPMAWVMRLTPSGGAYVQMNQAIRELHPRLWLMYKLDKLLLNPLESAASIHHAAEYSQNPSLRSASAAVVGRNHICITAQGEVELFPLVEEIWAVAPFLGVDWICTKYLPPVPPSSIPQTRELSAQLVCPVLADNRVLVLLDEEGDTAPIIGYLSLLLGEFLFTIFTVSLTVGVVYRTDSNFPPLRQKLLERGLSFLPLADLLPVFLDRYGAKTCARCATTSYNSRFDALSSSRGRELCQYCAAFQDNLDKAMLYGASP